MDLVTHSGWLVQGLAAADLDYLLLGLREFGLAVGITIGRVMGGVTCI